MPVYDYSDGLTFAIMLNSNRLQRWQFETIEALMQVPGVKPVLLIMHEPTSPVKKTFIRKVSDFKWHYAWFNIYYRYFFKPACFATKDVSELLINVPAITCAPLKKGYNEYFTENDIVNIKSFKADFILKLGFGIVKGDILTCTPMGIWSFHHGDEQKYRGVPPAFWEIYNNDHKTGAILQRLTNKLDSGVILRKGLFKTIEHSWMANLDQAITLSKKWPADVCREIIAQGTFPDQPQGVETTAPLLKIPGNTTFVLFLVRLLYNKIRFHLNELFYCEIWQTGLIKARTAELISDYPYSIDVEEVDWFKAKHADDYLADGFALKYNERLLLLYEDYSYKGRKGRISSTWYSERSGSFTEPQVLLDQPWHLSYPYLFKHNDKVYCIPECKDHKNVVLYRLDSNTMKLVHERTLIKDLEAVDPTLLNYNNHWYLFFTAGYASNVELHIWHAENLEDEFKPHVLTPVKADISNCRPAGTPFYLDGKLYRPAQDCSRSYGGRIILNEIKILSEDYFLEMAANVLEPPKPFEGLHNISFAGDFMFFDCKQMKFSLANFIYQIQRKIGIIRD